MEQKQGGDPAESRDETGINADYKYKLKNWTEFSLNCTCMPIAYWDLFQTMYVGKEIEWMTMDLMCYHLFNYCVFDMLEKWLEISNYNNLQPT